MIIKGEYEFDITIQNMFHTYKLVTTNHNIVTNNGMVLILKCALGESEEYLGDVWVGTNSQDATVEDTSLQDAVRLTATEKDFDEHILRYTISTDGGVINNTSEIGIIGTEGTLVTRDVHDRFDIPSTAQITLKYTLMLTNVENEELEEEENI